jgi:hypothetical protein
MILFPRGRGACPRTDIAFPKGSWHEPLRAVRA